MFLTDEGSVVTVGPVESQVNIVRSEYSEIRLCYFVFIILIHETHSTDALQLSEMISSANIFHGISRRPFHLMSVIDA